MTINNLYEMLNASIPECLSEPWDNDGKAVVPDGDAEVAKALVALDCTGAVIEKAAEIGANVIITHHPLIFKPMGAVVCDDSVGKRVIKCIENGISVMSFHTRFDSLSGGVNDVLASRLGLENTEAFLPYGRIGDVAECDFSTFFDKVRRELQSKAIITVDAGKRVRRVALVSGCGKDEISAAIGAGADTFVTGEVMHNHLIDCAELGLNLVCAGHYETEAVALEALAEIIRKTGIKAEVYGGI